MRPIATGKQPVSFSVAAAILALSLVVNLPGLAVSPMLADLKTIFPHSTQFEEQLLSLIPNLVIFPFVLLSGRLSLSRHKIAVVVCALILFTLSAAAYFFCHSMSGLIVISGCLGAGAGLLIPFSTGLISDVYDGTYRTRQMGLQSGISNMTLVAATFLVGVLASGNWHLPFVVYLVALIPLAMTPLLRKIPKNDLEDKTTVCAASATKPKIQSGRSPLTSGKTWATLGLYFLITYITVIVSLFCPYLVEKHSWSPALSGTVTSVYFLFVFIPGFILPWILRTLGKNTFIISSALILAGMAGIALYPHQWMLIAGSGMCGLGYGIMQPVIYDKATKIMPDPARATQTLAIVLSSNYLAIVLTPEIVDGFRSILHASSMSNFAFALNAVISIGLLLMSILMRDKFAFRIDIPSSDEKRGSQAR